MTKQSMYNINLASFPTLHTQRLILRPLRMEDAPELFKLRADKSVNEFIERIPANDIEDVIAFIFKILIGIDIGKFLYWAICLKKTDHVIGTICFCNIHHIKEMAELGFELRPEFQGEGIMSEAIDKIIDYGFCDLKFKTIKAVAKNYNYKSVNLLIKKGFKIDSANLLNEEQLEEGYDFYYLKKENK